MIINHLLKQMGVRAASDEHQAAEECPKISFEHLCIFTPYLHYKFQNAQYWPLHAHPCIVTPDRRTAAPDSNRRSHSAYRQAALKEAKLATKGKDGEPRAVIMQIRCWQLAVLLADCWGLMPHSSHLEHRQQGKYIPKTRRGLACKQNSGPVLLMPDDPANALIDGLHAQVLVVALPNCMPHPLPLAGLRAGNGGLSWKNIQVAYVLLKLRICRVGKR